MNRYAPTPADWLFTQTKLLFNFRSALDDPAVERGVIHYHTPLAHHLLELLIRNRIRDVPSYAPQNDLPLELTALKVAHATTPPPLDQEKSIAEHSLSEKLRQNLLFIALVEVDRILDPSELKLPSPG